MPVYLALTPEARAGLTLRGVPLVHIAYAIDEQGRLSRSAPRLGGGLMGLSDRCGAPLDAPEALIRAILRECAACRFGGVFADFDPPARRDRLAFLEDLGGRLARGGRRLYVPMAYAVPTAVVLVCTAVSGGTLSELLNDALRRFGAKRLALDAQRLSMDFQIPCPGGEGRPLPPAQIEERRAGAATYFSRELCARYFTYREGGATHFVLYDDAQTLRRKLALGRELGIDTAFFMYPEVSDILPALFA